MHVLQNRSVSLFDLMPKLHIVYKRGATARDEQPARLSKVGGGRQRRPMVVGSGLTAVAVGGEWWLVVTVGLGFYLLTEFPQ
jgi:hypothetical protein